MTRQLLGWIAVIAVTALASFWAFWGSIEAFHEGWYAPTLGTRLIWVLPYLTPAFVFALLGVVGIRWPLIGAALFAAIGAAVVVLSWRAVVQFHLSITLMFTIAPIVVSALFMVGRPQPKKRAYVLTGGLPLLVMVVCGSVPAYHVATRIDDGYRGERRVAGNGVELVWAPAGPAWDRLGNVSWHQAMERCRYVTHDGLQVAAAPQDAWRLPTIDELVRSMVHHGRNAGGEWHASRKRASYKLRPDKESPLWDTQSRVIYWWTNSEAEHARAWSVTYNGLTATRQKTSRHPTLGFRAVREARHEPSAMAQPPRRSSTNDAPIVGPKRFENRQ